MAGVQVRSGGQEKRVSLDLNEDEFTTLWFALEAYQEVMFKVLKKAQKVKTTSEAQDAVENVMGAGESMWRIGSLKYDLMQEAQERGLV